MIYDDIQRLISYALKNELIAPEDVYVIRNHFMEVFQLTDWQESVADCHDVDIDTLLCPLVDYACSHNIISDTTASRDLFDTKLMGILTPMPREVTAEFRQYYAKSPETATNWYYDFSKKLNYVRQGRIARDLKWTYESEYGTLDITINRSKPEKDPKDIAAAKSVQTAAYPRCQLCPENAGFARDENGKIVVTDSKIGVDFNIKTAQKILDKAKGGEAFIPIVATKPDVKSDELSSTLYCDELSSYSSSYTVGNTGRAKNLELASSKLNGTELLPGEVFSYVGTVGNGTYEEGYVDAPVYADGEVATGVAGGICQGSSTLYCAVLFADLKVVERVNHSMPVGYVPYGMDATIATPYIDFKFSNSTDYPLKIEATASGGVLKIRLIGTNTEPSKEVEISNKKIETIPYETKEIETEDLSPGEKRIKQNGSDGCVVETYKTINIDGAEKSTVKISTSRYSQIPKIVEIGKDSEDKKDYPEESQKPEKKSETAEAED